MPLPDVVMQRLGLAPPPVDDSLAGLPGGMGGLPPAQDVPLAGSLHPSILQAIGVQQPQPAPQADGPLLPPSLAAPPPPQPPAPSRDFAALPPAGYKPEPEPARAPAPPRPLSPDQQVVRADVAQEHASAAAQDANTADTQVKVAQADAEQVLYDKNQKALADIDEQIKRQQEDAAKTRATKDEQLKAIVDQRNGYKIDRDKYMKEMGLGDKLRWGIGLLLSNIGDAMQGKQGPNTVLMMMQEKIKQSVESQMDERDRLDLKVGGAKADLDEFDKFSRDRIAQSLARRGAAEADLAREIRATEAKFKSPQALANGAKHAAELEKSAAEKLAEASKRATDVDIQKRQLAVSQGNLAVSRFSAGETQRHNLATEDNAAMQRDLEAAKLLKAGKSDEAKLIRERSLGGEAVPVKDANGKIIGAKVGLITNKAGEVWIPQGTEPSVTALQKQHNSTLKLHGTLGEILRLGPEWLSDTANSDKKQKLDELWGTAKLQAIEANNLGVPTGKDVELATGTLGTESPTRMRTQLAGLLEADKTLIRNHRVTLETAGLDKQWSPPDLSSPPVAPPTIVEKLSTTLKAEPDENPERAYKKAQIAAYKENGGDVAKAHVAAEQARIAARNGEMSQGQKQAIADLKALALAGGDDGAAAIAALQDAIATEDARLAKKPRSAISIDAGPFKTTGPFVKLASPLRELAAKALGEIKNATSPTALTPPTESAGPTYDPNGYDPASLVRRFNAPVQPTLPTP